jgi:hypothetical protein
MKKEVLVEKWHFDAKNRRVISALKDGSHVAYQLSPNSERIVDPEVVTEWWKKVPITVEIKKNAEPTNTKPDLAHSFRMKVYPAYAIRKHSNSQAGESTLGGVVA